MKLTFKINKICYIIAIEMMILYTILFSLSTLGDVIHLPEIMRTIVSGIIYVLLGVAIINSKYSKKEFIVMAICVFLGLMIYFSSQDYSTLTFFLFCFASKNIELDSIFSILFKTVFICVVVVISFGVIGIIPNKHISSTFLWDNRMYLGFKHPNFLGTMLLNIVLLLYMKKKGKLKIGDYIFIFGLMLVNFFFPKSKTALLITGLFLLIVSFSCFCSKKKFYLLSKIGRWFPIGLTLLTFILIYLYNEGSSVASFLNVLLSNRVEQLGYYLNKYGIKLFGQKLITVSWREVYLASDVHTLDNGYLYLLLGKGVVFFFIYMYLTVRSIKNYIIERVYYKAIVIILLLIWGFMETSFFSIDMCPIIIILAPALLRKNHFIHQMKNYQQQDC